MSKQLLLTVLERGTMRVKSSGESYHWEIDRDYIGNPKSRFELSGKLNCAQGDFLMAKLPDGTNSILLEGRKIKPFFFGIVDSFETTEDAQVVLVNDFYNLANIDFAATYKSGSNAQDHVKQLLNRYLFHDPTKLTQQIVVSVSGQPIAYSYQPSDPPTVTNLVDYLVNLFKKYELVWEVEAVGYDAQDRIVVYTIITQQTKGLRLKNNVHDFINWDVFVTPAHQAVANMLQIVDKKTKNSENPTVLATWYIDKNGLITQDSTHVSLPSKNKVFIYDTTAEDKPSYEAVARSELSASNYGHEIRFDVLEKSDLLGFADLSIGLLATIVYEGKTYSSILTGYKLTSDDRVLSLTFGYTRSSFKSLLVRRA